MKFLVAAEAIFIATNLIKSLLNLVYRLVIEDNYSIVTKGNLKDYINKLLKNVE